MSNPTLPNEVLHLIAGKVPLAPARPTGIGGMVKSAEQSKLRDDLWNYALASRSSRDAAYSLLFSSFLLEIVLVNPKSLRLRETAVTELSNCTAAFLYSANRSSTVSIARKTRTFSLVVHAPKLPSVTLNDVILRGGLPRIFDSLHGTGYSIESLSICVSSQPPWDYAGSDNELRQAFQNLLSSPYLRHLQIDGVINLPQDLLHGTRIQKIELYNFSFTVPGIDRFSNNIPGAVESLGLDIFSKPQEIPQIMNQLAKNGLEDAYFRLVSPRLILDMIVFIASKAKNLTKLRVALAKGTHSLDEDVIYPFTNITKLSDLRISDNTATTINSSNIVHVLQSSIFPPTIQRLVIELTLHISLSSPSDVDNVPGARDEWSAFDELFRQALQPIPTIIIHFNYRIYIEPSYRGPTFDERAFEKTIHPRFDPLLPQFSGCPLRWIVEVHAKAHDSRAEYQATSSGSRQCIVVRYGGRDSLQVPLYIM